MPLSSLRRLPYALGAGLAMLIGLVVASPSPAEAFDEGSIHALTNQARAASGLGPLRNNSAMNKVALDWANSMAAAGSMRHNPNYASQIPGGWSSAAENVAQGYPTGAAVHQGWMGSSGHRANILGDFTDIGIAHVAVGGTTWSVQVFGKYGSSVPAPAPAPPAPAPVPPPPPAPPAPKAPVPKPAPAPENASGGQQTEAASPTPVPTSEAEPGAAATPSPTPSDSPSPATTPDAPDAPSVPAGADADASWWWSALAITGGVLTVASLAISLVVRRSNRGGRDAGTDGNVTKR